MKHILIVITSFRHGGTNKSLENLLSLIDTNKYQVDVFAMDHYGPYKNMLPNCNILKKDKWVEAVIAHWSDTKGIAKFRSLFIKTVRNLCNKFINFDITNFLLKSATVCISKRYNYDTIISYSEGVPTIFVSYFKIYNKIAWIHCDYGNYLKIKNNIDETTIYSSFNSIVCVSEYTKKEFCCLMPSMEMRTHSIHNILNSSHIFELSKEKNTDNRFMKSPFNIISIGRNDWVKRVYIIPQIARTLKDKGCEFKWYLIGPPGQAQDQKKLEENMAKYKINDHFSWLGAKDNPYPYIAQSDLLVNVSVSEACPYVINEAKILHIPVVCTNFGSAQEFIENGINGFVTPIDQITDKIEWLIKNKEEYNRMKKNISGFRYNNEQIISSIYNLF